jgi:hypothetical protein
MMGVWKPPVLSETSRAYPARVTIRRGGARGVVATMRGISGRCRGPAFGHAGWGSVVILVRMGGAGWWGAVAGGNRKTRDFAGPC